MSTDLPAGWSRTKLGELGEWTSGGTPSRTEPSYYGPGIPWVKTGDLPDGPVLDIPESITALGLKNSSAKCLPKGTLLVAMYGATIGKLGLLESKAATNQACAALLPHGQTAQFIPYVFQYLLGQREELRRIGQGGAQPNISQAILKDFEIPFPPLGEQRRIVAKLAALQARSRRAREALDAVPPLLEKLRQSTLAAAFRGDLTKDWRAKQKDIEPATELLKRIRTERRQKWESSELAKLKSKGKPPIDDKWKAKYKEPESVASDSLPVLADGWCWASVDEVSELQLGQQRSPEHAAAAEAHPYIRAANITWDGLDISDIKQMGFPDRDRYRLLYGDVLLSEASGSASEVGKPAIWRDEIEDCYYQKTLLRVRPVSEDVPSEWLHLGFLADALLGRFARMAPGVGILHLTADRMLTWPVALAPALEQARVMQVASTALTRISILETKVSALENDVDLVERSCLAKAFRGELVPQDPNDEPAEAMLARARSTNGSAPANGSRSKRGRQRATQSTDQPND